MVIWKKSILWYTVRKTSNQTKLIVVFHGFANVPKKKVSSWIFITLHICEFTYFCNFQRRRTFYFMNIFFTHFTRASLNMCTHLCLIYHMWCDKYSWIALLLLRFTEMCSKGRFPLTWDCIPYSLYRYHLTADDAAQCAMLSSAPPLPPKNCKKPMRQYGITKYAETYTIAECTVNKLLMMERGIVRNI